MLTFEDFGHEPNTFTFVSPDQIVKMTKAKNEGCQLFGHIFLKPVPGSFHVSVHGKGAELANIFPAPAHQIHQLEFTTEKGETTSGSIWSTTNMLDSLAVLNVSKTDSVTYYLKLVPSIYSHPFWGEKPFFQFAADCSVSAGNPPGMSRIEFKYDIDPIVIEFRQKYGSVAEFFIEVSGIIGGIFALSMFIDRISSAF
jgi:Endoplasmic reticulum vesicle transporter